MANLLFDTTRSSLLNASVDGLGNRLTLYFSAPLDSNNLPSLSQFTIKNDGSAVTISDMMVVDNQLHLYFTTPLNSTKSIAISYNDATSGNDILAIQDVAGNDAQSFQNVAVTTALSLTANESESFAFASSLTLAGAEISAFDAASQRLFVTSSAGLQVISVDDNLAMSLLGTITLGTNDVTSVAVKNGIVAASVVATDKTQAGTVYFLDADGDVASPSMVLGSVAVGALPDMLTFTADGKKLLVANEGEQDTLGNNPEGSVSIINLTNGVASATVTTASFTSFNSQRDALKAEGVRLFAGETGFTNITVAQDLEPEYISISPDGATAFVTLQENNAIGVLDIASATFTDIVPLGLKSFEGIPFDGSDKDGVGGTVAINLQTDVPVYGIRMPDAISSFRGADGKTYYVIANEGDDRNDFLTTPEAVRLSTVNLDDATFSNEAELKTNTEIGRLTISNAPGNNGDIDGDGDIDQILAYGARSFTILDEAGRVVFDSGSHLEEFTAAAGLFTDANGAGLFDDTRSDNKAAEAEGITIGYVGDKVLAFVGLERGGGGVMVYDVTNPQAVSFVDYLRNVGDEAPEGLTFIAEDASPSGKSLLVVTNEESSTVTLFTITNENDAPSVAEPLSDITVAEDSTLFQRIGVSSFADLDAGDSLTFTATLADGSALPEWLTFNASHHDLETMEDYFLKVASGTGSYSTPATDSASAGTAIATGIKTVDGNIAWERTDSAGGALTTIAETLRADLGYAIGVASTVPFSHATPATFVSHDVSRNNYWDIAHEILFDVQPEVVIGGGYNSSYFAKAVKSVGNVDRDLDDNGYNDDYDAFVNDTDGTEYVFVQRTSGTDSGTALSTAAATVSLADGEKLFGLYGTSGGNFEYYEVADTPGTVTTITRSTTDATPTVDEDPTFAEVTNVTLSVLNQDSNGFFVMLEQGDIDWTNHANDYENMVGGVYDLETAVTEAENFIASGVNGITWSNTLVIVTSDHSNSYLRAQQELGLGDLPTQNGSSYPDGDVTYGTGSHTNELVSVSARGAGASYFGELAGQIYAGTEIIDNTQIYDAMMHAATAAGAEHIVLFIGDGMNIEHEIAGSRYLYGTDFGLTWHDWGTLEDGWNGYATTWDVTAYNKYATAAGAAPYSEDTYDPLIGYNPEQGGDTPYPVAMTFSGTPTNEDVRTVAITVTATDESGASVSDTFELTVSENPLDVEGSITFWKNGAAITDVTTTLSRNIEHGTSGFEFKNIQLKANGERTVELWANVTNHSTGSFDAAFVLPDNACAEWQSASQVPAGWTSFENITPSGLFRVGGIGLQSLAMGLVKLGTLTITEQSSSNNFELWLAEGQLGDNEIDGFGVTSISSVTGGTNSYQYHSLRDGNYSLSAHKAAIGVESAVRANDALAALKMAVELNPNQDHSEVLPYQYLAADVNRDGKVRANDALNILKMAVGLDSAPQDEWIFVADTVSDATMHRSSVDWSETYATFDVIDNNLEIDLIGIIKGDVDGSWGMVG